MAIINNVNNILDTCHQKYVVMTDYPLLKKCC